MSEEVDLVIEPPFQLRSVDAGKVAIESEVVHDPVCVRLGLQGRDEQSRRDVAYMVEHPGNTVVDVILEEPRISVLLAIKRQRPLDQTPVRGIEQRGERSPKRRSDE